MGNKEKGRKHWGEEESGTWMLQRTLLSLANSPFLYYFSFSQPLYSLFLPTAFFVVSSILCKSSSMLVKLANILIFGNMWFIEHNIAHWEKQYRDKQEHKLELQAKVFKDPFAQEVVSIILRKEADITIFTRPLLDLFFFFLKNASQFP